ncbi:MAG: hypothetical protein EU536_04850 [Promethearchaeota archaeon]|nr:MAG: hypothetical protein EU536_04850 [Candidatus Lokiarchaeota archaeon]
MSKEFASIMEAVSGDSTEEKVKVFSDVLDKITQFAVNTLDQLQRKVIELQNLLQNMQARVIKLEQQPVVAMPAGGGMTPGVPAPATPTPAPPPPQPKPMSPVSARAALQGELKELFAKRKR